MNKTDISKRLLKSYHYDLKEDFVAAAIKYDFQKSFAKHSGIAICLDSELYIFHYDSTKVRLEILDKDKWYIENKFDFIKQEEVASFFIHCEGISKEADPNYGYNYNGSYFLPNGKYYAEEEDFQFMSCVGFCLNVITGAIESNNYLLHEDWSMSDHERDVYFQDHMSSILDSIPVEKRKLLKNNQRRIYPIDYFTSSFLQETPISKNAIDNIKPLVEESIKEKFGIN